MFALEMRNCYLALLFLVSSLSAIASDFPGDSVSKVPLKPRFLYNIDAAFWFDNREYKEPWQIAQTFFDMRLSPEIGLGFTDKKEGVHRLMAGFQYIQPMGGNFYDLRVHPTVYYRYQNKGLTVNLGAIPYKYFIRQLPDFMQYDMIVYNRPNIQGGLVQYQSRHGYVEAMLDWRGMKKVDQREMFRATIDGEYSYQGLFRYFVGGIAQLNHKAKYGSYVYLEGTGDDVYISPNMGVDFSAPTPFDVLSIKASYIFGYQRLRLFGIACIPQGVMLECMVNWRWLGVKNTFYYGDNLMPFYNLYGTDLNQGDPFYQSEIYNRTDLYVYIVHNSYLNCYFSWNLHWARQGGLQHQQQLIAVFSLNGIGKKEKLRGLFDK